LKEEIRSEAEAWKAKGETPNLAVVMVGDDPASLIYAKAKRKVAGELGMGFAFFPLAAATSEADVIKVIEELNAAENTHGIMLELPLPAPIKKERVMAAVSPLKDVDGMHPVNRGYIMSGEEGLFPATPQSCIEIMLRSGVEIAGKHAVIVGRGETVGKPLVFLMLRQQATVTVCHSKTPDLGLFTRQADILIAAAGKVNLITKNMVKPGAVVIDAGVNETPEGICGDVDFAGVREIADWISPVPGGVGSLTTAIIMRNVLKGMAWQRRMSR
jgi:methylenetetrahydrofolate dehydrogenase (NADP+)/methenyltetrahydrofolate cyclohydrolase